MNVSFPDRCGSTAAVKLSALVLLLVVPFFQAAGQPVDLPARLSLDEARAIFLEHNSDLNAARAEAQRSAHEAQIPALWPNPSVSFQRNQTKPPGGGIGSENTLTLEQPLRYPGEHIAWKEAAHGQAAGADALYKEEAAVLYEELRTRYAAAVAARWRLDVLRTVTDAVRRAIAIGEARFEEGDISSFERRRLRVAHATYEDELEAAAKDDRDTRIELAYFLAPRPHAEHHDREEDELILTDSLDFTPLTVDYNALLQQALDRRGLQEAAEANTHVRDQVLRAERYARLPQLAVTAGYRGETRPGIIAPGFTVGLRVGLPVFHQHQPQVRAARVAASAASYEGERARRRIELDVHDAYERLKSYEQRIEHIAEEVLEGSDHLLEDALYVYEEGEIDLVELLDAVEATKTAQLLEIELVTQYHYSRYAMERAIGIGPQDPSPFE